MCGFGTMKPALPARAIEGGNYGTRLVLDDRQSIEGNGGRLGGIVAFMAHNLYFLTTCEV